MKIWRYFLILLLIPTWSFAATRIINQAFFLAKRPDKTWNTTDTLIVMGGKKTDIRQISRARKLYPRTMPIYWLLSDDEWNYNSMNLNRDQKVLDFIDQLKEIYIQVLPENLCPKPAVIREKTFDIVIIDSSWLLFPHRAEFFTKQCSSVDTSKFYTEIEEAVLNAKQKPLIMIAHHAIHQKLVYGEDSDSISRIATKMQQSMGTMDSISNPSYQKYHEKMNKILKKRKNTLFLSASTQNYYQDIDDFGHTISFTEREPEILELRGNSEGIEINSNEFSEPIQLEFNESDEAAKPMCSKYKGPMHDFKLRGTFFNYFLGSNYRTFWKQPVTISCFDLEEEGLIIDKIGGSLKSPDFQLKDRRGKFYTIRPMKKEVRLPAILEDTLVEHVLLDQQSSLFPLGFMLAAALSKQVGLPTESPKLVYIDTNQSAFDPWRERNFPSGFYQLVEHPINVLKNPEAIQNGVLEVLNTKEMVNRLESESGYKLNQESYLKDRLFDILIGDWDRHLESWQWVIVQRGDVKWIEPFPIDRDAAFYRGNGMVSWWRKRKWINYKYQDFTKRLKHADPMLVQSFSIDHRFTYSLTLKDWLKVVGEIQQKLNASSMEKAIASLPVLVPNEDRKRIIDSFQRRLKELPRLAMDIRKILRKSVDIVGTPGKDSYYIQSGPGHFVYVTSTKDDQIIYSDKFDTRQTEEIRLYGLDGDDEYKLNWSNYTKTKIRVIPGNGKDNIIARDQKKKPAISLYDDDAEIDSYYGFEKLNYNPIYNDFYSQVNQRKYSYLAPVLFLASSNGDTGFVLGGGVRYYNEGFQRSPWASINEIKANAVINRGSANVMYVGTIYDLFKTSDFNVEAEAGLPRFYGSYFGLGNSPPPLDETQSEKFYWMRARHFESAVKINIPLLQYISLVPRLQFRFRDYLIEDDSFLSTLSQANQASQLGSSSNVNVRKANYYLGTGLALQYVSADNVSGPVKKRIIRGEAKWTFQQGLSPEDGNFQTFDANA